MSIRNIVEDVLKELGIELKQWKWDGKHKTSNLTPFFWLADQESSKNNKKKYMEFLNANIGQINGHKLVDVAGTVLFSKVDVGGKKFSGSSDVIVVPEVCDKEGYNTKIRLVIKLKKKSTCPTFTKRVWSIFVPPS